jgi:capsular exopolysaccharide synthesis family protein
MDYFRLLRLIGRFKWLILLVVVAATCATFFGAKLKGSQYQATATIMPQEQALQAMDDVATMTNTMANQDMRGQSAQMRRARVESLIALMMSPRVLGAVIVKLQMPELRLTPADLESMITVDQVTPEVLRVKATAPSAELAKQLANGIVSTFVQFYGDLSTNKINESIDALTDQEQQAKKELIKTKDAVQRYKAARKITALEQQLAGVISRQNAARQASEGTKAQLAELDAQLRQIQILIAKAPKTIRQVEGSNDSPAAQQLRNDIGLLERDLALERGVKTEEHPRIQEIKARLESAKRRLRQEENTMIERVRVVPNPEYATLMQNQMALLTQRGGLAAKVHSLDVSVGRMQRELSTYAGADIQLSTLMQRYGLAEQRYANVATRLRQAEANADSVRRSSAIAIVDTSGDMNPPIDVSGKRVIVLTVAALCLSLALCVFVLAAWQYMDRGIRTTEDTESLVELPVAAIIPRALPRGSTPELPGLAALEPVSPEGEAYRFLALHLLMTRPENPIQVLMLATSKPGTGATTTISNLAATLAQGNRRVVLIDADLRRPSLHNLFNMSNDVGLTSILSEWTPLEEALKKTPVANLMLLPAGPMVENPWALLRSTAMESLLSRLREEADFILIDTPSAAAFADAYNLAPMADGVFMVIRNRHQPTGLEIKIKRMFEEAGAKVFGAVLNDVPMGNVESARYHAHYYGPDSKGSKSPALPGKS